MTALDMEVGEGLSKDVPFKIPVSGQLNQSLEGTWAPAFLFFDALCGMQEHV